MYLQDDIVTLYVIGSVYVEQFHLTFINISMNIQTKTDRRILNNLF